jgi:hypothetical protein
VCALNLVTGSVQDCSREYRHAIISTAAMTLLPNHVCFTAQVLGLLFLWLVSFMLSLYEMTNELVMTGLSRFALAI